MPDRCREIFSIEHPSLEPILEALSKFKSGGFVAPIFVAQSVAESSSVREHGGRPLSVSSSGEAHARVLPGTVGPPAPTSLVRGGIQPFHRFSCFLDTRRDRSSQPWRMRTERSGRPFTLARMVLYLPGFSFS